MNSFFRRILVLTALIFSGFLLAFSAMAENRKIADEVFYFVIPDRFSNGDPANDAGGLEGDRSRHGFDPQDSRFYHGGDLQGLNKKLPYLKKLGVTALWISPPFKNTPVSGGSAGYHGYWAIDYSQVDSHWGSNADLSAFIKRSHNMGIKVFLDVVVNHTGDVIRYQECHNADGSLLEGLNSCPYKTRAESANTPYTPFIPDGNESIKHPQWLNDTQYYNNQGDSTFSGESSVYGDFFGLDDLDTRNPIVVNGMIDIFKGWIKDFAIDGFRVDTIKHVDIELWQQWVPAIKAYAAEQGNDDFFIFGEMFDGLPSNLSHYTRSGQFPSVLDFSLYYAIKDVVADSQGTDRLAWVFSQDDYYTDSDSNANQLMNFVSNHDVGRIGQFINNMSISDEEKLARAKLAQSVMFFSRGVPVIYYGDEQGFTGDGGDAEAREDMFASNVAEYNDNNLIGTDATTADENFDTKHPIFIHLRDLAKLFKKHPELRQGTQFVRYSQDSPGLFVMSRYNHEKNREALVLINTSTETQSIQLAAMTDKYKQIWPSKKNGKIKGGKIKVNAGSLELSVAPLSVLALRSDKKIVLPDTLSDLTFSNLQEGALVSGLIEVAVNLSELDDAALPLHRVHFAVSIDGAAFMPLGTDSNPDYKVFFDTSDLADGSVLSFRATVDNYGEISNSVTINVEKNVQPGMRVVFKKPQSWMTANIYWWNAEPQSAVVWPGVAMSHISGDWYEFQFNNDVKQSNLIFNDGAGKQTANLYREGDGCYADTAWMDSCNTVVQEPGMTVYVHRALSWNVPNIYYWGAAGAPDWPGLEMDALGDDWYRFQFPDGVSEANIIFNDKTNGANGNQTADLFRQGDGCYEVDTQLWSDSCAIPGFTVYFQKPVNWETVYSYFWNTSPVEAANVAWPGEEMAELGENWFSYQFPNGVQATNLIFNDGGAGQQTVDLNREGEGCYTLDGGWADSCDLPIQGMQIHFKLPEGWAEDVNIYYWNAEGAPTWPGLPMTALGDGWYSFNFPPGVDSADLIFNDGNGQQSADLQVEGGGCYGEFGDFWRKSCITPGQSEVDIQNVQAHWLNLNTLAWQVSDSRAAQYRLYHSASAAIVIDNGVMSGADGFAVMSAEASVSGDLAAQNPHLSEWTTYSLNIDVATASTMLQGQLVAVALDSADNILEATRVQIPRVIDQLFASEQWLGVRYQDGAPSLQLWAPTAQSVKLLRYNEAGMLLATVEADTSDAGIYRFVGDSSWDKQYYRYQVTVYHPVSDAIEILEVSDPYSLNLSQNGQFSQMVDLLGDSSLKPNGWDALQKALPAHKDITLYEGHLRDFSISDSSVPEAHRGKYLAFTYNGENGKSLSAGMSHLKGLQQAGLSHFHLLPVFDISSIDEDQNLRVDLDDPFSRLCALVDEAAVQDRCATYGDTSIKEVLSELKDSDPTTADIQAIMADGDGMTGKDGFNWGYDPHHFNAPEGSYATAATDSAKVLEFRQMVKGLADINLKVVMDVVYNHTSASGLYNNSVLDKVVPGYYHRLNPVSGKVESSTCCDNTASEHQMMEKLMVDTLVNWAKNYKIDSFRFDLMGHIPKSAMQAVQRELANLNLLEDGVDGSNIYLYGEGWDFGEVSGGQRFEQASQLNMAGTGIGTFNDRIRSAIRGGNFTDNGRAQGWVNGNETFPNGVASGASSALDQADRIRIGLAGNLQTYAFTDNSGNSNTGLGYSNTGYTLDPQESINYVDKHDNETLWDNTQAKLPDDIGIQNRVRVHMLSNALINFAQGVPFYQMGTDLLRSKSLDRNSYNSGDWFNAVDFSGQTNNWAVGLPPAQDNQTRWSSMADLINNGNIVASAGNIAVARTQFREQLAIRYSSPLFRLDGANEVNSRVGFHNTGASQIPGLIAMTLSDGQCAGEDLDSNYDGIMVLFNADDSTHTFELAGTAGSVLHPLQANGSDAIVKDSVVNGESYTVAAHTAAVFVKPQGNVQGEYPCNPLSTVETEPGMTVYAQSPANWADIRIYYWNTLPDNLGTNWPGAEMQDLGRHWYSFQFPTGTSASNIIFNNNNNGLQTGDLFREGEGCFNISTDSWSDSCVLPGLSFWFKKPDNWSDDPQIYYWNAGVAGPNWPGVSMNSIGDGWYFFQLPDGVRSSNLIFNDANGTGAQTPDLYREQNGCYDFATGVWSSDCQLP